MDRDRFIAFYRQEIKTRWVDFKLTNKQMADWFGALSRFDVEALGVAVSEHYIEDESRSPSLKKIAQRATQVCQNESMQQRVLVLECVRKGRYRAGMKIRVNVLGRDITREKLADKMTELVGKFTDIYNGKWVAEEQRTFGRVGCAHAEKTMDNFKN
jgi:hypothetical protein